MIQAELGGSGPARRFLPLDAHLCLWLVPPLFVLRCVWRRRHGWGQLLRSVVATRSGPNLTEPTGPFFISWAWNFVKAAARNFPRQPPCATSSWRAAPCCGRCSASWWPSPSSSPSWAPTGCWAPLAPTLRGSTGPPWACTAAAATSGPGAWAAGPTPTPSAKWPAASGRPPCCSWRRGRWCWAAWPASPSSACASRASWRRACSTSAGSSRPSQVSQRQGGAVE